MPIAQQPPSQLDGVAASLDGEYRKGRAQARLTERALQIGRESGLFSMANPPDPWPLPTIMAALQRVSEVEPGVGWVAMNSFVFGHAAARLSDSDRDELLGQVSSGPFGFSGIQGGTATRTETGFTLNGRWPFLTGIEDCERAVLAGRVQPSDKPDIRFFIVEPAYLTAGTNWHDMAGLRTSGSHSAQVVDLDVQESLAIRLVEPPNLDEPLYRLPVFPYFFGGAIANYLGIFRGGVTNAIDPISGKTSSIDGAPAGDNPATQATVADADAALRACEASFTSLVEQMWTRSELQAG
jgi:alkylation response protein AidB-like acyl-CoA dehydrogenase